MGVDAEFFSTFVRSPGVGTECRGILRVVLVRVMPGHDG
jgi:hypothetical protein